MDCTFGVPDCRGNAGTGRHAHPLDPDNRTGWYCPNCQAYDWWLWFGGPLPVVIRCGSCGLTIDLDKSARSASPVIPVRMR